MSVTNFVVVQVALQDVTPQGTVAPSSYTGPRNAEMRVVARDGHQNSADSPPIETYIERELSAGRHLVHYSKDLIITGVEAFSDCTGVAGVKDFSTPATDEQLVAEPVLVRGVMLQAHPDNTGRIWVAIGEEAAVDKGLCLSAGDPPVVLPVSDLALIHALTELAADRLLYQAR